MQHQLLDNPHTHTHTIFVAFHKRTRKLQWTVMPVHISRFPVPAFWCTTEVFPFSHCNHGSTLQALHVLANFRATCLTSPVKLAAMFTSAKCVHFRPCSSTPLYRNKYVPWAWTWKLWREKQNISHRGLECNGRGSLFSTAVVSGVLWRNQLPTTFKAATQVLPHTTKLTTKGVASLSEIACGTSLCSVETVYLFT